MRAKKQTKAKEPIRLRYKDLANGNKSIYLDIYQNGKRQYDFLKLYLVPEVTPFDKIANKNTIQMAQSIKAQKIIELNASANGMIDTSKGKKILLLDWLKEYKRIRLANGKRLGNVVENLTKKVKEYRINTTLSQVDKNWVLNFIEYLNGTTLADNTKKSYLAVLNSAINLAINKDLVSSNPISKISAEEKPQSDESKREYLTKEEVKKLVETECVNVQVKQAFLFSCFCGLRYGDVKNLMWQNIITTNGITYADITMQKTQKSNLVPLSQQALQYLPERKNNDLVFNLPAISGIEYVLRNWIIKANISKHITFHCARHTFATMALSSGVDLYTTSKLLGHTDVKTTQIYAKIVDAKKTDAVGKIEDFFNN